MDASPEGTAEARAVGLDLRRPFGTRDLLAFKPSVETLGYSRLSLRDSKAAASRHIQNAPGVQPLELWVMNRPPQGEGKARSFSANVQALWCGPS